MECYLQNHSCAFSKVEHFSDQFFTKYCFILLCFVSFQETYFQRIWNHNMMFLLKSSTAIDDCAKDSVEELLTKILCGIEQISQSNQSKFSVTQSIVVKLLSTIFRAIVCREYKLSQCMKNEVITS